MVRPAKYHLVSRYRLSSDREAIWNALQDVPHWPTWWRWLKGVDIIRQPTSEDGVGGIYHNRIASPLRYGFTYETEVIAIDRPETISLTSTGDLEGRGRFDLSEDPSGGTDLTFTWLVCTPKWWMNLMAPIGRPAFVWNHDRLMTDFGRGLAATTGGEVMKASHEVLRPSDANFFEFPARGASWEP